MDLLAAQESLTRRLFELRNADGGWPYYAGRKSRLESTCWAALGADASVDTLPLDTWIGRDGLLVEPSTGEVNFGFNGLAVLTLGSGGHASPLAGTVVTALAEARGDALPPSAAIRQDNSLQGWSWTKDTFSWVEPTAWCLLALKKSAQPSTLTRERVTVAENLLRDRECKGGGWNSGTAEVYGKALPVPPTAVGAMALQDLGSATVLTDALSFLDEHAHLEGSTSALALSALAFACVGRRAERLLSKLVDHHRQAEQFGNVAAIGMAAYALRCAHSEQRPNAFAIEGVA